VLAAVENTEAWHRELFGQELHAPALLDFEVVSVLRGLTLNGHLGEARAGDLRTDFNDLPVQRWPSAES